MKRPTFFISSTIYDFRDLRSSIKFYLEEQGCKVLASEFNDFEKPLDKHSYEACLQSIHAADYFVLLIGSRVGGWYDQPNRISITQREYREAYQLHLSGKLKILAFVRSEVWQMKEDRRELSKYLESTMIDSTTRRGITNYSSKSAQDAEFIMSFLNEVGKNKETKLAVEGKAEPPTGNWIHIISEFRDVVDVLQGQVFLSIPIEDMTVRRLLRRELQDLVGQCLIKIRGGHLFSPRPFIDKFHSKIPITLEGKGKKFTTLPIEPWDDISSIAMHLLALKLHPVVLPQVLARPTFLEFDLSTNSYRETPAYEALLRLQEEIRRFNVSNTPETLSVLFKHSPLARGRSTAPVDIETTGLAALLHLLDRWSNALDLSVSLIRHLDGNLFVMPELRPDTPVHGMQQMLDDEKVSSAEVNVYINRIAH